LLISTDPAHSLSDSLAWPVGGEITPVADVRNCFALALDAAAILADFNRRNGAVMQLIASRGTYFDQEDIASFFALSMPGMDEVMAIVKIMDLMRTGDAAGLGTSDQGSGIRLPVPGPQSPLPISQRYDLVILDTAPAGHTIRLLALPEHMEQWIHVMDMMLEKHRYMVERFRGHYTPDEADRFLTDLAHDIQQVRDLLRDPRATEFVPVINAEAMSIYGTETLLQALHEGGVPVRSVILNRLAEVKVGCPFCQARGQGQAPYATEIAAKFGGYHLVTIPLMPHEVRGVAALTAFGDLLFGPESNDVTGDRPQAHSQDATASILSGTKRPLRSVVEGCGLGAMPAPQAPFDSVPPLRVLAPLHGRADLPEAPDMTDLLTRDLRFILVGGKGGVGKTTVAAATALAFARRAPAEKTLIFSTDPASALPDSLGCAIGDAPAPVPGVPGLYAVQVNAEAGLADLRERYMAEINEVFDSFLGGGHLDIAYDRDVMLEMISLIPPGLDEIISLISLMDLLETGVYDRFVLDTAPTGHMLRLLEMPGLAIDWFKAFFRLLIKYSGVVTLNKTAQLMVDMFKGVKKVQAHLADAGHTEFIAVTIPEAMGVYETERFLASLDTMQIPCRRLVINMVVPPTDCAFCQAKRAEQQTYIAGLRRQFPHYAVTELPLFPHEIRRGVHDGLAGLGEVGDVLYGGVT
jgi:arsenite-transporting ATPase